MKKDMACVYWKSAKILQIWEIIVKFKKSLKFT